MFNVSTRRVGGIRFVKIGRFTFSFCISRSYRPLYQDGVIESLDTESDWNARRR
jgi:hypothetical protein